MNKFDQIPELQEQLIEVMGREVERLHGIECPNEKEVKRAMALARELGQLYVSYRILREQMRRESLGPVVARILPAKTG